MNTFRTVLISIFLFVACDGPIPSSTDANPKSPAGQNAAKPSGPRLTLMIPDEQVTSKYFDLKWDANFSVQGVEAVITSKQDCTTPILKFTKKIREGYKLELSNISDGIYYLCLRAFNDSGQEINAENNPISITVYTKKPGVFSINGPNEFINTRSPTVSWEPAVNATTYNLIVATDELCETGIQSYQNVTSNDKSLTVLSDGTYYLCVTANDEAGNLRKAANYGRKMVIDSVAPGAFDFEPVVSPAKNRRPLIAWSQATDANTFSYSLSITDSSGKSIAKLNNTEAGEFRFANDLPDDSYNMTLIATDAAGNTRQTQRSFTIDNIPPNPFRLNPRFYGKCDNLNPNCKATSSQSVEFSVSIEPSSSPVHSPAARYLSGFTDSTAECPDRSAQIYNSYTSLSLPKSGYVKICSYAEDSAGNYVAAVNNGFLVQVDLIPPAKPKASLSKLEIHLGAKAAIPIIATEGAATYELEILNYSSSGSTLIRDTSDEANQFNVKGWNTGYAEARIVALDLAGNQAKSDKIFVTVLGPPENHNSFYVIKNNTLNEFVRVSDLDQYFEIGSGLRPIPDYDVNFSVITSPKNGSVPQIDNLTGAFKYVPNGNYTGEDQFVVKYSAAYKGFYLGMFTPRNIEVNLTVKVRVVNSLPSDPTITKIYPQPALASAGGTILYILNGDSHMGDASFGWNIGVDFLPQEGLSYVAQFEKNKIPAAHCPQGFAVSGSVRKNIPVTSWETRHYVNGFGAYTPQEFIDTQGKYYFRVCSQDAAGNRSPGSLSSFYYPCDENNINFSYINEQYGESRYGLYKCRR